MDPITAISLASSIITFIDYATQIVTGTYEVYKSATGSTEENTHIQTIIGDLRQVTDNLDSDLVGKTKHERALKSLASKCEKLSDELLHLLEKLTVSGDHSTWKSLKVKIRSIRKEKEVAGMEKRLVEYRSQILLRLTFTLSDQQSSIKVQLDRLEHTGKNLSNENATHLNKVREDISKKVEQLMQKQENLETSVSATAELKECMGEVQESLKTLSSMLSTVPKENRILEKLFFPSMNLREETITDAEEGTFEWIFEEEKDNPGHTTLTESDLSENSGDEDELCSVESLLNSESEEEDNEIERSVDASPLNSRPSSRGPAESDPDTTRSRESSQNRYDREEERKRREEELNRRARTRAAFLTWLRAGGGVFHISGKAGSGKSTLMKFLCGHERTEEELKVWAGEKKKTLVFARFFFWKSNDDMQMSLEGLYRSILFETLKQCPDLIPVVFPIQWEQLENGVPDVEGSFRASAIQRAFDILTTKGKFPQHRFCFFVDGLDEYRGESPDHLQLAESIQRWASGDDVKICASSRPYFEYLDMFSSSPDLRIHLHELTQQDIYLFSRQMIENHHKFDRIKDEYLQLVEKVVQMSEGVFLWARLVVRSLLTGMLRHDTTQALEKKLSVIPRDINELYNQLLDSLEPDDREQAAKLLLLTVHNPFPQPLNLVMYAWIDNLSDPQFPPTDGNRPSSWPPVNDIAQNVQRQLTSLTKGLLEVAPLRGHFVELGAPLVVQFFHRTARDFVLKNSKLENVARGFPSLIEAETYHRLLLALLTVQELSWRLLYWNHYMIGTVDKPAFQQGLPLGLLTGFSCVLNDGKDTISKDPDSDEMFHGTTIGFPFRFFNYRLSFVHMAAYTGQQDYVFQELSKNPGLLTGTKDLSIVLSAAIGNRKDLVLALLQRGSSPSEYITWKRWYRETGEDRTGPYPIWMILAGWFVGCNLIEHHSKPNFLHDILEFFLQGGVDASNCLFLMRNRNSLGPATHFITLEQFIQDTQPPNMDRLLTLLNRGGGNSYISSLRGFVSRLNPLFKEVESVVDKQTRGYTRFKAGPESCRMELTDAIWGDVRTRFGGGGFRIF